MDDTRFVVSDAAWLRIEPLLVGRQGDRGATGKDNRLFLEAVLWRVRTGLPWRDLPTAFGNWNSVFRRFRRWAKAGVFERLFKGIRGHPGFRIRAYRRHDSPGSPEGQWRKRGTLPQAIERSRGGLTTKIVTLVDRLGNLCDFNHLPGQGHDLKGVAPLIKNVSFAALLADKAFDADWLLAELEKRGAAAVMRRPLVATPQTGTSSQP